MTNANLAVVIPAYRVTNHLGGVIHAIEKNVDHIIVVDDACPDGSGDVAEALGDPRVHVVRHATNQGVGGATVSGYKKALELDVDIVVKLDGDGQMNPADIKDLIAPIEANIADYTKGNRFSSVENVEEMPFIRIVGNAGLSFLTKVSSGYWNVTDPTNGFTAIRTDVLREVRLGKLHPRFFFESDMLFRLNLLGAAVADVPMKARYGNERSNLSVWKSLFQFPWLHFVNHMKRIFYSYYLRELSIASFELPLGLGLMTFGIAFGLNAWAQASAVGMETSTGNVMIAALPIIFGFQMVLAFLSYDIASTPKRPRRFS